MDNKKDINLDFGIILKRKVIEKFNDFDYKIITSVKYVFYKVELIVLFFLQKKICYSFCTNTKIL